MSVRGAVNQLMAPPSRLQLIYTLFVVLHIRLYVTLLIQCCNFHSMLQSLAYGNVLRECH